MGEAIGSVSIGSGRVPGEMIRGDDPLPTADAVRLVVQSALSRCLPRPGEANWPPGDGVIERARIASGLMAHAALVRLCPEVSPARVARMLFIDPAELADPPAAWVAEAAAEIVISIQGEG